MKSLFITIAFLGLPFLMQAQCNCQEEFSKIKNYLESNYAGFKDKVTANNIKQYKDLTAQKEQLAAQAKNKSQCYFIINQWMSYFNDNHLYTVLNAEAIEKINPKKLQSDFPIEKYSVSDALIKNLENAKGLEGIYTKKGEGFSIAVLKNKNPFRDYVAMVVNSTDSKYENGTVLAELKEKSGKEYFLLYNSSNKLAFATIKPKDGELISGFFKNGREIVNKTNYNFESKLLNENTLYFNIPSFSWEAKPMVDSLFAAQKENLSKTSSLIIDLRNNGGGSDDVYSVISPYLYTQPIKGIGVDIWASNDNIRGWEVMLQDPNLPLDNKADYQKMVDKLKLKINQNVNIVEDYIDSSYTMLLFPKNVVILINDGCASSTEQFLLEASQSKKVTLMGQNTSGTLDYSNLRESDFCEMPYRLWSPTTRSRRIDIREGIDGIGIKPNIYLTEKQDWIEEALNFLNVKLKNNR
ncbi:S41 family peptidase [Sediminibacterium sp.]|jgi:hypothetical protein|uniref:S41 family peptidase n=1 Tax=Sediminibacterium sp. TaxID=1917865 RepID=UPI003F6FDE71